MPKIEVLGTIFITLDADDVEHAVRLVREGVRKLRLTDERLDRRVSHLEVHDLEATPQDK